MQGHGEVLLRGEIEETLDAGIHYLRTVDRLVRERIARGVPRNGILDITIEECGLSRIPLGGLVQKLHQANLLTLYDAYRSEIKPRRVAVLRKPAGDQRSRSRVSDSRAVRRQVTASAILATGLDQFAEPSVAEFFNRRQGTSCKPEITVRSPGGESMKRELAPGVRASRTS